MKSLRALAKKLPKDSVSRVILESALSGMAENEQRYRDERSEFERKRDERREQWAKRNSNG